jgi:hypothetical protein
MERGTTMTQSGYRGPQEESHLWWRVAAHLDAARLAAADATAHGLDDPSRAIDLQDKLRDSQAILLEIFRAKGLLPNVVNGAAEVPRPPAVPAPPVVPVSGPEDLVVVEATGEAPPASAAEEASAYEAAISSSVSEQPSAPEVP